MKILCPKILSNVFVKTIIFALFILFFCLLGLFLTLKNRDVPLSMLSPAIEKIVSDDTHRLSLTQPILHLADGFNLQILTEKAVISSPTGKINFQNIAMTFPLSGIYPTRFYIEKISLEDDFINSSTSGDQEILLEDIITPKEFYDNWVAGGFLKNIKTIKIDQVISGDNFAHALFSIFDINKGGVDIRHNSDQKTMDILLSAAIKTEFFQQKAILQIEYNHNKGTTNIGLNLDNIHKKIGEYDIDFLGKTDLKIRLEGNNQDGFKAGIINVTTKNSRINFADKSLAPIRIKKLKASLQYFIKDKKLMFSLDECKTDKGDIFLSALLERKNKNRINFALKSNVKNMNYQQFFEKPINIPMLNMAGFLERTDQIINIDHLYLRAQKADISGKLSLRETKPFAFDIKSHLHLKNFNKKSLISLWPIGIPGTARSWIDYNVHEMALGTGTVNFKQKHNKEPSLKLDLPFSKGRFSFRQPISPIEAASGVLSLTANSFTADIDKAILNNMQIKKAKFHIPELLAPIPKGKINIEFSGKMLDLMGVLDQAPLQIFTKNKMSFDQQKGLFSANIRADLPLLSTLKFEDVDLYGYVDHHNTKLDILSKKYRFRDMSGRLNFEKNKITSDFIARINNQNIKGNWQQFFSQTAPYSSIINAKGRFTNHTIENLHIPISDYIEGDIDSDIQLKFNKGRIASFEIKANAAGAKLKLPLSAFEEPAGKQRKNIYAKGYQSRINHNVTVKNLRVTTPQTDVQIENMIFSSKLETMMLKNITIKNFVKNLSGRWDTKPKRADITIKADYMNAAPFIAYDPVIIKGKPLPPLFAAKIDLDIHKLDLYPSKTLRKIKVRVNSGLEKAQKMYIAGNFLQSDPFKVQITRVNSQETKFSFSADNVGKFIKSYARFPYYKKGKLFINGTMIRGKKGEDTTISGDFRIKNGMLYNAPTVAKLLSFASMTGIVDRLSSDGVDLDKVTGDFVKKGVVVNIKNGTLSGSGFGLSFGGDYNFSTANVDFSGSVIPLYEINSAISHIPILGDILTSRSGEGIIGVTYSMKGKITKPDISANPLSAFTPGILRRVFE